MNGEPRYCQHPSRDVLRSECIEQRSWRGNPNVRATSLLQRAWALAGYAVSVSHTAWPPWIHDPISRRSGKGCCYQGLRRNACTALQDQRRVVFATVNAPQVRIWSRRSRTGGDGKGRGTNHEKSKLHYYHFGESVSRRSFQSHHQCPWVVVRRDRG